MSYGPSRYVVHAYRSRMRTIIPNRVNARARAYNLLPAPWSILLSLRAC